jgi:KaiC/GvpD/RAD55 family RecA-like ATPase
MNYDVFISHASEDKEEVARPLAEALRSRGLRVWFDEMEIKLGDSLRRRIDDGLLNSRFGLVVLSHSFFAKEWPKKELDALVAREDGSEKVILPIWHGVSRQDILMYSVLLADKLAAPTSKGVLHIVGASRDGEFRSAALQRSMGKDIHKLVVNFIDQIRSDDDTGPAEATGVRTGFTELDRQISGLQPGALTLLAGQSRTGKTTFIFEVAQHVALVEGLPVLLCASAASAKQSTDRLIAMLCGIPVERLRAQSLTAEEWARVPEVLDRLGKSPMLICDEPSMSVFDLQEEARRRVKLWGAIGVVLVDSMDEIVDSQSADMAVVCRELKRLARELNCPVLATSALSRALERRPDSRPMLADLAEVGSIEHFLDVVLFAHLNATRGGRTNGDTFEIIVAKQREGGPLGTVELCFGPKGRLKVNRPSEGP